MNKINPQDYDNLFRYEGDITVLHSEFFLKGSHGKADPLIIFKDGTWSTFINKQKEKVCLKEGLKLFSSKDGYNKFAYSFREYLNFLDKEFKRKFSSVPDNISKKEFVQLINDLSKFWCYYGYTEFLY